MSLSEKESSSDAAYGSRCVLTAPAFLVVSTHDRTVADLPDSNPYQVLSEVFRSGRIARISSNIMRGEYCASSSRECAPQVTATDSTPALCAISKSKLVSPTTACTGALPSSVSSLFTIAGWGFECDSSAQREATK